MVEPRWDDSDLRAGTMVRAALWLIQVVGEGNTFTKEQLRNDFPGVTQVDRRVRELRKYDWQIDTNTSDVALLSEEQRFTRQGVEVWDERRRRAADRENDSSISGKERLRVLAENDFQCGVCGIAGGEAYPDRPSETAVLTVSRRDLELQTGHSTKMSVSECKRCRKGSGARSYSVPAVRALLEELQPEDLRRVRRWLAKGVRGTTSVERAWNGLRTLPVDDRSRLLSEFDE